MKAPTRVAIYMRVSTTRQTNLNQFIQLRKAAKDKGWSIVAVYRDHGRSGKDRNRPAFQRMMEDSKTGVFDVVMVYSPSRLGRNTLDSLLTINELGESGVDVYSISHNIDTTTRIGRALFSITSVFAEMEREELQERIQCGLERARSQGKKLGRSEVYRKHFDEVVELRSHGYSIREIASSVGIASGTVQKIINRKREML